MPEDIPHDLLCRRGGYRRFRILTKRRSPTAAYQNLPAIWHTPRYKLLSSSARATLHRTVKSFVNRRAIADVTNITNRKRIASIRHATTHAG